jgi:hypothetical protein
MFDQVLVLQKDGGGSRQFAEPRDKARRVADLVPKAESVEGATYGLTSEVELMRRVPLFSKMDLPTLKPQPSSSDRPSTWAGLVQRGRLSCRTLPMLIEGKVAISRPTPPDRWSGALGPMDIVGETLFADVAHRDRYRDFARRRAAHAKNN